MKFSSRIEIVDMVAETEESARLDGGDVLFTGHEFFVGMSARSNREGAALLERVFQLPVTPVDFAQSLPAGSAKASSPPPLHLKSIMTQAAPGTRCPNETGQCGEGRGGQRRNCSLRQFRQLRHCRFGPVESSITVAQSPMIHRCCPLPILHPCILDAFCRRADCSGLCSNSYRSAYHAARLPYPAA